MLLHSCPLSMQARFVFDGSKFTRQRMEALVERFLTVLDAWATRGSRSRLHDLPLLSATAEQAILSTWVVPAKIRSSEALLPYQVCAVRVAAHLCLAGRGMGGSQTLSS